MAILLVEQYHDFAEALADRYLVMERGEVIACGPGNEMADKGIRQLVAIQAIDWRLRRPQACCRAGRRVAAS